MRVDPNEGWHEQAACRTRLTPQAWDHDGGVQSDQAVAICWDVCPVREVCYQHSVREETRSIHWWGEEREVIDEPVGIRGGFGAFERLTMLGFSFTRRMWIRAVDEKVRRCTFCHDGSVSWRRGAGTCLYHRKHNPAWHKKVALMKEYEVADTDELLDELYWERQEEPEAS